MLNCDQVLKCISDYSVGALDVKTAASVEAHLASCPDCASELRVLEASIQLVESMPQVDPPAGMWNGVYQRISRQESFGERIRYTFFQPRRALAAGFAVLVVLVALTFSKVNTPTPTATAADISTSEYVQGHAFFASQDAFADRYGLASVAGVSILK